MVNVARILSVMAGCLALAGTINGAENTPLALPAPWVQVQAQPTGDAAMALVSAGRALELGLSSVAVAECERILADPTVSPELRNAVVSTLAVALLEEDRAAEATKILNQYTGERGAAWSLRAGLAAVRERRLGEAKGLLAGIKPDELAEEERGWWYYGQGLLADAGNDFARAANFFQQAIDAAASEGQRARFILGREKVRLLAGEASEAMVKSLRQTMEKNPGGAAGFGAASRLAVALAALDRKAEAVGLLQVQLQALGRQERAVADEWELLLGLIAGAEDGVGRSALLSLIAQGKDRDKQRVALRMLSGLAPESAGGAAFRVKLDEMIEGDGRVALLGDLLLCRAELMLRAKNFLTAEGDADRFLKQFPGSDQAVNAYCILASAAWEQARYLSAAGHAARARAELAPGQLLRQRLGVVMAEAFFRAKDFRNAADAYGTVLQEKLSLDWPAGALLFQQMLSEIEWGRERGNLDGAQEAMERASKDVRFDAVSRWQAEWNLARALQEKGNTEQAAMRVSRLVESEALPVELRVRMLWLRAQLALATGDTLKALEMAEKLEASLDGVASGMKEVLAANALLLQAEAGFATKDATRVAAAREKLRALRSGFPKAEATVFSYVIEADAAANIVEAQGVLQKLVDQFPESLYAPHAKFQIALYEEQRAADYRKAYTKYEEFIKNYPGSELVFSARLRQGHLLRLLNDFSAAEQTYRELVNNFSQSADIDLARLALADCQAAQASANTTLQESARLSYERLFNVLSVPVEVRIEAGFKCGLSYDQYGNKERARDVWWKVLNEFLVSKQPQVELGAKGRYWLARTVVYFADLLDQLGDPEEAKKARALITSHGLPGGSYIKELTGRPSVSFPIPNNGATTPR